MAEVLFVADPTWAYREFIPGGNANRYVDIRARQAVTYARFLAPKRTGYLSTRNKKTGTLNRGRLAAVCTVYNDADYASFVALGTIQHGLIGPNGPKPMPIPVNPRGLPYRVNPSGAFVSRRWVRGQTANDFLGRAMERAFRGGRFTYAT